MPSEEYEHYLRLSPEDLITIIEKKDKELKIGLFRPKKILRLRALPRGLFVQKKGIIREQKVNKLVFRYD